MTLLTAFPLQVIILHLIYCCIQNTWHSRHNTIFVHMPTPKVFGLFLNASSTDPLEPLEKSDLFHHLQV
jgi:hypothetical protein